jgi:hypothetical protein
LSAAAFVLLAASLELPGFKQICAGFRTASVPRVKRHKEGRAMTAYNAVRVKVKAGRETEFLENQRRRQLLKGMREAAIFKTGERTYCVIGKWDSMNALVAARPEMIATLDTFRDMLEDLGGGLGVTDPVSGEAVVELKAR